jgi:hypothetical protein
MWGKDRMRSNALLLSCYGFKTKLASLKVKLETQIIKSMESSNIDLSFV